MEDPQGIRGQGRHRQEADSEYHQDFFRGAYAPERCRSQIAAGADGARRHHGDSGVPVGNKKQDQGRIRQVAPESVAALPADVRSGIPAQWSYSSDATAARYGGVKLQLSGMLMFFGSFRDVREKVLEPCTCSVV